MEPSFSASIVAGVAAIAVAWITARGVRRHRRDQLGELDSIRDQLTPSTGNRFADEIVENRHAIHEVAIAIGEHEIDPDAHNPHKRRKHNANET